MDAEKARPRESFLSVLGNKVLATKLTFLLAVPPAGNPEIF
jgi:hypothetical protein